MTRKSTKKIQKSVKRTLGLLAKDNKKEVKKWDKKLKKFRG